MFYPLQENLEVMCCSLQGESLPYPYLHHNRSSFTLLFRQLDHKELSALSGCHCALEILHRFYDERRPLLSVQCSLRGIMAIGSLNVMVVRGDNNRAQVVYTGRLELVETDWQET